MSLCRSLRWLVGCAVWGLLGCGVPSPQDAPEAPKAEAPRVQIFNGDAGLADADSEPDAPGEDREEVSVGADTAAPDAEPDGVAPEPDAPTGDEPVWDDTRGCWVDDGLGATGRLAGSVEPWGPRVEASPWEPIDLQVDGAAQRPWGRFVWRVVKHPDGARATPEAAGQGAATLVPGVVGAWMLEARGVGGDGQPVCVPGAVQIEVVAAPTLLVELIWSTPGDPDEADTGAGRGSDVDLHLLHPRGSWDNNPWDCYWLNISPNWGDVTLASDDPVLRIDDTDGAGPETIHMVEAELTTYRVGAYYFSDHGYGLSMLRARVFLGGALIWEGAQTLERAGQFWDMLALDLATGSVQTVDEVHSGFP